MVERDGLAQAAAELRNDGRHPRRQGKLAVFDCAKNQCIGERLGYREKTEDRGFLQRAPAFPIAMSQRFEQADSSMARDRDNRAEIAPVGKIALDRCLELL